MRLLPYPTTRMMTAIVANIVTERMLSSRQFLHHRWFTSCQQQFTGEEFQMVAVAYSRPAAFGVSPCTGYDSAMNAYRLSAFTFAHLAFCAAAIFARAAFDILRRFFFAPTMMMPLLEPSAAVWYAARPRLTARCDFCPSCARRFDAVLRMPVKCLTISCR